MFVIYSFFNTVHGSGKGCVSVWHSLNCKDVEKYSAVNSASSFQRPSLHVTVLNYMRNILTAMGTWRMNICVAVKSICRMVGEISISEPFSCAVEAVMKLQTHNFMI